MVNENLCICSSNLLLKLSGVLQLQLGWRDFDEEGNRIQRDVPEVAAILNLPGDRSAFSEDSTVVLHSQLAMQQQLPCSNAVPNACHDT